MTQLTLTDGPAAPPKTRFPTGWGWAIGLLAALLAATLAEAAPTETGEAPFEAFAAEILDGIATPEDRLGTARPRIAVWPFSKDETPVPATLAGEFNQRLLAALARR